MLGRANEFNVGHITAGYVTILLTESLQHPDLHKFASWGDVVCRPECNEGSYAMKDLIPKMVG